MVMVMVVAVPEGAQFYENIAVFHKLWAGWLVAGWLVVGVPKFMKVLRASRNLMVWGLAYKPQAPSPKP